MRNAIGIQQALRKSVFSKRVRSVPGGASINWQVQANDRWEARQTNRSNVQGKQNGKRQLNLGNEYADKILVNHGRGLLVIHKRS
jgi:hypothetical protein